MSRPSDHDLELSEEEFRLLRDFVHERFGLFFEDSQRASFKARLAGRLASLDLRSFEDYYHYLRFGPQRNEELRSVITHLTNNETYFYREPSQLQVFGEHVLRAVKERKGTASERRLRILSAGCSTGEEPYTLAMIVYDSGQFFWNWEVQVVGLDVDSGALDKARRAVYFHNSFRSTRPDALERHFVRKGTGQEVKDGVRRLVQFREGNLLEAASYEGLAPVDVVLCRNVLIYFSDEAIRRVVRHFYELLTGGGFLFLGHAESLARITDAFTPVRFKGAMIYQKPERAPSEAAP